MSKKKPSDNVVTLKRTPLSKSVTEGIQTQALHTLQEDSKATWEDLYAIYESIAQTIITTGKNINDLLTIEGVKDQLVGHNEFTIAMNGLSCDLSTFSDRLAKIHDRHKGRTGVIEEDDVIASIEISEDYKQTSLEFQSVVLPTVVFITTEIGEAADKVVKLKFPVSEPITAGTSA